MKLRRLMPSPVAEAFFNVMLKNWKPEQKIERYLQFLNESDREVLRDPVNRDLILSSMKHARLQGAKGIVVDSGFYHRDWLRRDCDSRRLQTVPTVYFHGKKDRILNHGMAEWMHKANPKSQLQFFEDEGHYSLPLRQAEFILDNLKRA